MFAQTGARGRGRLPRPRFFFSRLCGLRTSAGPADWPRRTPRCHARAPPSGQRVRGARIIRPGFVARGRRCRVLPIFPAHFRPRSGNDGEHMDTRPRSVYEDSCRLFADGDTVGDGTFAVHVSAAAHGCGEGGPRAGPGMAGLGGRANPSRPRVRVASALGPRAWGGLPPGDSAKPVPGGNPFRSRDVGGWSFDDAEARGARCPRPATRAAGREGSSDGTRHTEDLRSTVGRSIRGAAQYSILRAVSQAGARGLVRGHDRLAVTSRGAAAADRAGSIDRDKTYDQDVHVQARVTEEGVRAVRG